MGLSNVPWHLHTNMMLRWRWGGVGADGTCCYADVTLMEHVASLVHVVTIREHRFD